MSSHSLHSRWISLYALLSGLIGLGILAWLFASQQWTIDPTLMISFTTIVSLVSYFRVPIYPKRIQRVANSVDLYGLSIVELALDSAFFVGGALAQGLAFGAWAAFIAGVVTPLVPPLHSGPEPQGPFRWPGQRWARRTATGILNGARNVIALSIAWLAYWGLGGETTPVSISILLGLALGVMFVVLTLARSMWILPVLLFQGDTMRLALERLWAPEKLLIEISALPVSLLVSATWTQLGWSSLLLLSLTIIGMGAMLRQMARTVQSLADRVEMLTFAHCVHKRIEQTPRTVDDLCLLAWSLSAKVASASRFEMGLYDGPITQINLRVVVANEERLPPMTLPITPLWEWLSERHSPLLVHLNEGANGLPFRFAPLDQGKPPQCTMLIPVLGKQPLARTTDAADGEKRASASPLGAMVVQSDQPYAFYQEHLEKVYTVATLIGQVLDGAEATTITATDE